MKAAVITFRMKMAMWGSGSLLEGGGKIVCCFGWAHVPLTSMPSLLLLECLGTRHPHHGSWIRRMDVSDISRRVMSTSCWRFMFADNISRVSNILVG